MLSEGRGSFTVYCYDFDLDGGQISDLFVCLACTNPFARPFSQGHCRHPRAPVALLHPFPFQTAILSSSSRRTDVIPAALLGDYQKLLSSAPTRRLNPSKVWTNSTMCEPGVGEEDPCDPP